MPQHGPTASPQSRPDRTGLNPDPAGHRNAVVVPFDRRRRRVDDAPVDEAAVNAEPGLPLAAVLPLMRADSDRLWDDADAPEVADEPAGPAPADGRAARATELDDGALAALVQRVVGRDEKALEALYDATSARVHGLVWRIVQRAALAEEVVEDTYWQVWRQAPRFDGARGRPMTWLLAMARSRAIDALRRDERFRHEELAEDGPAADGAAASPPPDLLDATRNAAALHAALSALEPKARQLVALAFFRGLTHEEIAEREAMPLGSVKSLIRRSLQAMRRALEAP